MTKRKNPLKNIDAFLKQEATSLVTPDKINTKKENTPIAAVEISQKKAGQQEISKEDIIAKIQTLSQLEGDAFRASFYDIIKETLEKLDNSTSEDKMLINTILYIKDRPNWKENIQAYWQNK